MYKLHLMICLMKPFNNAISYIFAHQYANCGVVAERTKISFPKIKYHYTLKTMKST